MCSASNILRLVTLTDGVGREFRSRIEDVSGDLLLLARPLELPAEHDFLIGAPVLVSWPEVDGYLTATTELIGHRRQAQVGLWVVRVIGDYHRQQRRHFVRVPALGPVQLALIPETAGLPFSHIAGHLLDLSEAALRCAIRAEDAPGFGESAKLMTDFAIEDQRFSLPATVLKAELDRRDPGTVEVVLSYLIGEDQAAPLRRGVFAEQLRLRNRDR